MRVSALPPLQKRRRADRRGEAPLLLLLITAVLSAAPVHAMLRWPSAAPPVPQRTGDQCLAAAGGRVLNGDSAYAPLARWLGLEGGGGAITPPKEVTDVTTLATLVQLAAPGLQLVLDPLLFLRAADGADSGAAHGGGGDDAHGGVHGGMHGGGAAPHAARAGGGGGSSNGSAGSSGSGSTHGQGSAGPPRAGGAAAGPPRAAAAIPKLIHMTLRSKHRLLPHQALSILSWGAMNPGYALLLYDDADIEGYVRRREGRERMGGGKGDVRWQQGRHGGREAWGKKGEKGSLPCFLFSIGSQQAAAPCP